MHYNKTDINSDFLEWVDAQIENSMRYRPLTDFERAYQYLRQENKRLSDVIHLQQSHPDYEYKITEGPRKAWDGEPYLDKEGWEEYKDWERFSYHEERYWCRKKIKS